MQVEYLRELEIAAREYPNYQHRLKPDIWIDKQALASFSRLSDKHKELVLTTCHAYGITDLSEIRRWRYMAQTNLFFLCKLLEKYKDTSMKKYIWIDGIEHNTHEEICNEFFVRKDPTIKTFKEFANGYVGYKERLLLVPRGGFKSSMDMADTVQYIICWPEVTILILTGVLDLAKDFVKEIKGHFELEDGMPEGGNKIFADKNPLKPRTMTDNSSSLFQVLFPEHCIPREDGKSYEYQTPACAVPEKECTVTAAAIEQNLAGWHVGVLKLDDVVTNVNSRTIDRIKAINTQVSINQAMLHPYGFYDKIGTWYNQQDTYGQDIQHIAKCLKEGEDVTMKVYLRPAWWPNVTARKLGKIEAEMVESDWELWFNEVGQLTYKFLKAKKSVDPDGFAIKYLNDPTQVHRIKFPRELLQRRTVHSNQLPEQGMIVCTVDTAYSTKSWADYTVIITALIYGGRFYVIDMKRGRYNEYELPQIIAANALQWKPKRISIEDSVGVKWLGKEIYKEMEKLRIRVPLEFVPLGQGNKGNAKDMKAKPVLRLLGDDRLVFSHGCVGLEEIYTELEKFGTAAATHDDIVSALSILVEQYGTYAEIEGRTTTAAPGFVADQKTKQFYDMTYGLGQFSKSYTQKSITDALNNPELTMQEAIKQQNQAAVNDFDPLADAGLY